MLRQQTGKCSVQLLVPGKIIADILLVVLELTIHHNSKLFLVIISIVSPEFRNSPVVPDFLDDGR